MEPFFVILKSLRSRSHQIYEIFIDALNPNLKKLPLIFEDLEV